MKIHIDFETRSTVDLKKTGVHVYAEHPTTDVLCCAYAIDDGPVVLWEPAGTQGYADDLLEAVRRGGLVYAHNAAFEIEIWNNVMVSRYGWPPLPVEQTRCTMAMAYSMSLPGALENVAPALGVDAKKDDKGHRIMLQLCKPRSYAEDGTPVWWDDPDKCERLYEYCRQDVEVERAVEKRMLPLSDREQKVWQWDQQVNARGIHVDIPSIEAADKIVAAQKDAYNEEIRTVTNNAVSTCQAVAQIADWLVYKGVPVPNGVSKPEIVEMLKIDDLPPDVARALTLRQEAGKSSTAKLTAMLHGAGDDHRVRGTMQYHAAGTGRWGGRRIQPQNYPRQKMSEADIEAVFEIFNSVEPETARRQIDMFYGPPMQVVSECLRTFITAGPGNELIGGDFSNIEGRMLAWLAGEEWKLEAFRDFDAGRGHDIYTLTAALILGKRPEDVTKEERQAYGKVPELALGFGGGVGAFNSMAAVYGVDMAANYDTICEAAPSDAEYALDAYEERGQGDKRYWVASEVVKLGWRKRHVAIVPYWGDLEEAACNATLNPGHVYTAGPSGRVIKYVISGSFLWCRLPSGRVLCYPYPQIKPVKTPWGATKESLTYMGVDQQTRKWVRQKTYGGKLSENVTQAAARDVLVDGMGRVEVAGYPVVMHVHDEAVCELEAGTGSTDEFSHLMSINSPWCAGLPIAVDAWRGQRYTKR